MSFLKIEKLTPYEKLLFYGINIILDYVFFELCKKGNTYKDFV